MSEKCSWPAMDETTLLPYGSETVLGGILQHAGLYKVVYIVGLGSLAAKYLHQSELVSHLLQDDHSMFGWEGPGDGERGSW